MITAVVVNFNEPTLERCLQSLSQQTVKLKEIIIADGGSSKEQLEIARQYGRVLGPIRGIGKARVQGILAAETEYVMSADSDTLYAPNYCEMALENLKTVNAVRAASIWPLEWTDLLTPVEMVFSLIPPYEYAFAFRKSAFLAARIHEEDYSDPRSDIGWGVMWRLWPRLEPRMTVWTRLPTKGGQRIFGYSLSALMGFSPVFGVVGICTLS